MAGKQRNGGKSEKWRGNLSVAPSPGSFWDYMAQILSILYSVAQCHGKRELHA
jgi:hypothetical protein